MGKEPTLGPMAIATKASGRMATCMARGPRCATWRTSAYSSESSIQRWRNDNRYEGEWKDDTKHGFGIKTWANGDRFEGSWRNGSKHGGQKDSPHSLVSKLTRLFFLSPASSSTQAKEPTPGPMGIATSGNGGRTKSTGKESSTWQTARGEKEPGKMTSNMYLCWPSCLAFRGIDRNLHVHRASSPSLMSVARSTNKCMIRASSSHLP